MRKIATHVNPSTGEPCACGFDKFSEPLEVPVEKTAGAKLDWIREREDKFFKTEEGRESYIFLDHIVNNNNKLDPLVPWLWREMKKGQFKDWFDNTPRAIDVLSHMADWFASKSPTRRGVDIMQLNWEQMEDKIAEWDKELQSKDADLGKAGGGIVHDFGNGWTIRKLTTAEEAEAEGDTMGHCVGSYGSIIESGHTEVFSLRDPENKPHATIELNPSTGKVRQIQGKGNKEPIPEYQEMVGNWLLMNPEGKTITVFIQREVLWPPQTVEDLWNYVLMAELVPRVDEVEVEPKSWEDFFNDKGGSYYHPLRPGDDGYNEVAHEAGMDIFPIKDMHFRSVVLDAFDTDSPAEDPDKLEMIAEIIENNGGYHINLDEDGINTIRDSVLTILSGPYFQSIEGYLGSYPTLYESWEKYPLGDVINRILGYSFINKETDRPVTEQAPTTPPSPEVEPIAEPAQEDQMPPAPTDLENPEGRIGKFLSRFRRGRKANILDEVHQYLSPDVWQDASSPMPILRPEINDWVSKFVIDAFARHGYTDMDSWLSLVLTGSLTTYQYSPNSDFDISVFVDAESFPEWSRAEMIAIMMDECEGMIVPGTSHELQCYVVSNEFRREDLYKPGLRSAYDLATDKWIVAPEKDGTHDVVREMNEATTIALENADKMEKLIRYEPLKAIQFYEQVHRRRRRDMEAGKGDYAPSNISYKMLEQRGLIKQVTSLIEQYSIG